MYDPRQGQPNPAALPPDQSGNPQFGQPQPQPQYGLDPAAYQPPLPPQGPAPVVSGPPAAASPQFGEGVVPGLPNAPVTSPDPLGPPTGPFMAPLGPPAPKKSPVVPVLAALAALLLIATGVFVTMFVNKNGDLKDANATIAERDDKIDGLSDDVTERDDQISQLEDDLAIAQGDAEDAEGLQTCLDAIKEFFDALATEKDEDKIQDLADEADLLCQQYWL